MEVTISCSKAASALYVVVVIVGVVCPRIDGFEDLADSKDCKTQAATVGVLEYSIPVLYRTGSNVRSYVESVY